MRGEDLLTQVEVTELLPPGSTLDDFLTLGHGVEVAMTDTGKTNDMRYFVKETKCIAFAWNPEHEPMPGVVCRTPHEVYDALVAMDRDDYTGPRKINFLPPADDDSTPEAAEKSDKEKRALFRACRSIMRALGDMMREARGGKAAPPWCIIFIDEVQQLTNGKSDPEGILTKALKEDRKRGIRYWMFTQEPSEVPHVLFTQSQVFMLKEVKAFRVPYLEDYGLPMHKVWRHIQKKYHYAVVVKNQYALCTPLPEA